jgi:hypothetical protein
MPWYKDLYEIKSVRLISWRRSHTPPRKLFNNSLQVGRKFGSRTRLQFAS